MPSWPGVTDGIAPINETQSTVAIITAANLVLTNSDVADIESAQ
jgi:hypothetical protein